MMRHTSKRSQVNLSNLRLRGGHGFPAFNAARLASRIATIFFACARVSSRRLAETAASPYPGQIFPHVFLIFCHYGPQAMHHKPVTMQETRRVTGEVRVGLALSSRNSRSEASDQLAAAAFARARSWQAARKAFISARSTTIRLATPLYFFVVPVTVRLTAPWWTRP